MHECISGIGACRWSMFISSTREETWRRRHSYAFQTVVGHAGQWMKRLFVARAPCPGSRRPLPLARCEIGRMPKARGCAPRLEAELASDLQTE